MQGVESCYGDGSKQVSFALELYDPEEVSPLAEETPRIAQTHEDERIRSKTLLLLTAYGTRHGYGS